MCRKLIYSVSFVLVLGLSVTSAAKADLVGWWRFEEGSGATASDSSGNGHHGTLLGIPEWVLGPEGFGGALAFNPDRCIGVDCGIFDPTDGTGHFTVALWAFWDGTGANQHFLTKSNGWAADTMMFQFELWAANANAAYTDRVGVSYQPLGSVAFSIMPNNEWVHLAVTFDGSNAIIYLNGVDEEGPKSFSIGPNIDAMVEIGYNSNRPTVNERTFHGALDDVHIYSRALTAEEIQQLMIGIPPGAAFNPNPADKATDVPREVVLSWTPGEYAPPINGHKVYLSENFNDVNEGIGGVTQDANSYAPSQRLELGTTYYWRVDEVNGPPDYTVHEGSVWSFATEPLGYPIENIIATASSAHAADMGPENTINGSGLDDNDLHSAEETTMWLSSTEALGAWIQYEFDKVYKLHEMWVWNCNQAVEPLLGFGLKDVTIEYSTNGNDYTTLGTSHEFAQAPGTPNYAHNTTIDLGGVGAKYVRLTANSNWGGILPQYGLCEVRFFYIPVQAREPNPADGQTDVSIGTIDKPTDVTLGFKAGRGAATHNVYLSTDEQAVIDGTADVTTATEASYGPLALDLGRTYYWRVDEVNEAETPTTWQGDLWNFATQEYFIVDDIESYNDLDPGDPNSNRIFFTWIDGWEVPTNGSQVGYSDPPFCEQTIVHGGEQSMPLLYDNSGTARYSEASMTLSSGQDWTVRGAEALSLWFRGNRVAFVEEPAGTFTINAAGADIWDTADEFRYAWKQLSGDGQIVAKVLSVEDTDPWAKAGVMIRDTLDAGSPNVFMAITGGGGDGATFQWRTAPGGSSSSARTLVGISPPASIKLVRQASLFTGYVFLDGQWQQEGRLVSVTMTDPVYIGLAVTSHAAGVTCQAVFSDIQITGAVSGQFTEQAIGVDMPSNSPAPMYVTLANSGGTPVVVYHDDPSASQMSDWTEWLINLKQFSDGGVNLTNVNTISIGFGGKNNPQPGGLGIMYFDDISLYPSR